MNAFPWEKNPRSTDFHGRGNSHGNPWICVIPTPCTTVPRQDYGRLPRPWPRFSMVTHAWICGIRTAVDVPQAFPQPRPRLWPPITNPRLSPQLSTTVGPWIPTVSYFPLSLGFLCPWPWIRGS